MTRQRQVSRRRRGSRWLSAALGVVAAVVLVAAPAAAAPPNETRTAIAFWDAGDPLNTRLSLQAAAGATAVDPGPLFLFVTQSYCDTATDELVFRSFFSQDALGPDAFRVHPLLKWATLDVSTTVSGFEQRLQGCASPTGFTSTDLGSSAVDVDVTWTATSDLYEVQPGTTARDATATGTITGTTLSVGSVGTSQFAQLRSQA